MIAPPFKAVKGIFIQPGTGRALLSSNMLLVKTTKLVFITSIAPPDGA